MIRMWLYKDLLSKLRSKFNLVSYQPNGEYFEIGQGPILPVTLIDSVLNETIIPATQAFSITGTGYIVTSVVPYNERWTVHFLKLVLSTGTYTFSGITVLRTGTALISIKSQTGAASIVINNLDKSFKLEPGWSIEIYCDSWAIIGNANYTIMYEREFIY